MAAILFYGVEPYEQIVSILLTEDFMWNLVKIGQAVLEKMFKDYMILNMYTAKGQVGITPRGQFWLYFNHTLQISTINR